MKCNRCGRAISANEGYVHQGRLFCEDCLMEIGLPAGKCQPWATYLAGKERVGLKGTEGLTELQKQVYEFIKRQGKTTREEVKQSLKLSEAEINAQLTPLMHAELVKERAEKGKLYLIPVS